MKQSVDMLPKDQRKDMLRQRKEEKDIEQAEKVMKVITHAIGRALLICYSKVVKSIIS